MEIGCERRERRGNERVVMKGGLVKHVRIVVRGKNNVVFFPELL